VSVFGRPIVRRWSNSTIAPLVGPEKFPFRAEGKQSSLTAQFFLCSNGQIHLQFFFSRKCPPTSSPHARNRKCPMVYRGRNSKRKSTALVKGAQNKAQLHPTLTQEKSTAVRVFGGSSCSEVSASFLRLPSPLGPSRNRSGENVRFFTIGAHAIGKRDWLFHTSTRRDEGKSPSSFLGSKFFSRHLCLKAIELCGYRVGLVDHLWLG